jgi:disulfide bond formation protein DsbB
MLFAPKPRRRTGNLAGFLACVAMLAYAFYSQFHDGLDPCPLCIFQRIGVAALGVVFLLALLHNPGLIGARIYAILIAVTASAGAAVAGRHVWLTHLPPDQVPACGPGLEYMLEVFPLGDTLRMVLTGSGECAKIDWQLFGLSMPAWVLISIATVGVAGVIWNWRRTSPRDTL